MPARTTASWPNFRRPYLSNQIAVITNQLWRKNPHETKLVENVHNSSRAGRDIGLRATTPTARSGRNGPASGQFLDREARPLTGAAATGHHDLHQCRDERKTVARSNESSPRKPPVRGHKERQRSHRPGCQLDRQPDGAIDFRPGEGRSRLLPDSDPGPAG